MLFRMSLAKVKKLLKNVYGGTHAILFNIWKKVKHT